MVGSLVLLSGCEAGPPVVASPAVAGSRAHAAAGAPDWRERPALPLLLGIPLEPVFEKDQFSREFGYLRYGRTGPQELPAESPFEKDEQAVSAAREWIVRHFGAIPQGITLTTTSVQRSASGRDRPAYDWDSGHTVTFDECYNGIPVVGAGAVIYIKGKTEFSASITLAGLAPAAGSSRRIIDRAGVVPLLQDYLRARDGKQLELSELGTRVQPRLCYVAEPTWGAVAGSLMVLGPNWALDSEPRALMNAHTGRLWQND